MLGCLGFTSNQLPPVFVIPYMLWENIHQWTVLEKSVAVETLGGTDSSTYSENSFQLNKQWIIMNWGNKKLCKILIAEEIFAPVIKKFDRIKVQSHYKDEWWSIYLNVKTCLKSTTKTSSLFLQWLIFRLTVDGYFLFTINHEKYNNHIWETIRN